MLINGRFFAASLATLAVLIALPGCRDNTSIDYDPLADNSLTIILEQPGHVSEKITEWIKSALTEQGKQFIIAKAEELSALIDGRDPLYTPALVIPDARNIDLRHWWLLTQIINSGVRVHLIGEEPFSRLGIWREHEWIAAEGLANQDDSPLEFIPIEGSWVQHDDELGGQLWVFEGAAFPSEGHLGILLTGVPNAEMTHELKDEKFNRWTRNPAKFNQSTVLLWDEFTLIDRATEEAYPFGKSSPYTLAIRFHAPNAVTALQARPLLIRARGDNPTPVRPFLGGISPALQRVEIFDPLEFITWTGSRVAAESGQTRIGSAPTFAGRSLTLQSPWRHISLLEARRPERTAKITLASVLFRFDHTVRNRVSWLSLNPQDLDILRIDALWREMFKDAQENLDSNFVLLDVAPLAWTIQANEVPVFRVRHGFYADPDPNTFPRLEVEITPVGRNSPTYRSFTQRIIDSNTVEIQMPSTISPGEFDVRIRPRSRPISSTHDTLIQVEARSFQRVERIEFLGGYVFRDGVPWFNSGLSYRPSYLASYFEGASLSWLSPNFYDPTLVENDLATLAQLGVDSVRIELSHPDEARNLRDFLSRCLRHQIFVRINFSPLASRLQNFEEIREFVRNCRLDEHRIAWFWDLMENPIFGQAPSRASLARQWSRWVADFYGSEAELHSLLGGGEHSRWLLESPTPPDEMLTNLGEWCPSVLIYRSFLEDFSYGFSGEIVRPFSTLRSFGSFGIRSGWQGSLNDFVMPAVPWAPNFAAQNFTAVGIGWDKFDGSKNTTRLAELYIKIASQYLRADAILQFDGIGGDTINWMPLITPSQRTESIRALREIRRQNPIGTWWCGRAYDGFDNIGRHRQGMIRLNGLAHDVWLDWREKIDASPELNITAMRTQERADTESLPPVFIDPESDCRGTLGVALSYIQKNRDVPHSVTLRNPDSDDTFLHIAGLPKGRFKNISAQLSRIRVIDSRETHEIDFSRAGCTITISKGEVTTTLTFENIGLADWPFLSREEALNLRDMRTGAQLSRVDRIVRRGERADFSFRANAEDLVKNPNARYGLYLGNRLITITPEFRWTPTRDWRN